MKKSILSIAFFLISFQPLFAQEDSTYVYPQMVNYWTGTTDGVTKTDPCEIRAINNEDGWAMFDVSSLPENSVITSVTLGVYMNTNNFPYWSATPMPYNCVTASAPDIYAAIQAGQDSINAYLYIDEVPGFGTGWLSFELSSQANTDLQAAISQGWFAVGIASRIFPSGFILDGWCDPNIPYLDVHFSSLPVELTSFNAFTNQGNVVLSWITATEKNNKGFEVQRSKVGEQKSEWKRIGFVEGNGTTTQPHSYSFIDPPDGLPTEGWQAGKDLSSGKYLYRLKQIDFDGSCDYSNVIEVSIQTSEKFSLEQNFPNPFNPSTTLSFVIGSASGGSFVSLRVYDVLGNEVASLVNEEKPVGQYEVNFNAKNLPSGIYFYGLHAGSFNQIKKMILLK